MWNPLLSLLKFSWYISGVTDTKTAYFISNTDTFQMFFFHTSTLSLLIQRILLIYHWKNKHTHHLQDGGEHQITLNNRVCQGGNKHGNGVCLFYVANEHNSHWESTYCRCKYWLFSVLQGNHFTTIEIYHRFLCTIT